MRYPRHSDPITRSRRVTRLLLRSPRIVSEVHALYKANRSLHRTINEYSQVTGMLLSKSQVVSILNKVKREKRLKARRNTAKAT